MYKYKQDDTKTIMWKKKTTTKISTIPIRQKVDVSILMGETEREKAQPRMNCEKILLDMPVKET